MPVWVEDYLLPPLLVWLGLAGAVLLLKCRERTSGAPICGTCGYDLRAHAGAPGKCPECATAFELDGSGGLVMRRVRRGRVIIAAALLFIALLASIILYVIPILIAPDHEPVGMPI